MTLIYEGRLAATRQRGVVMVLTLIILVIMTLGSIALLRSLDSTNFIAGNLAFRQSAVHLVEVGIEQATNWLETNPAARAVDDQANGYKASWAQGLDLRPPNGKWAEYFDGLQARQVPNGIPQGYGVRYLIQRLCPSQGGFSTSEYMSEGCIYTKSTHCPGGSKTTGTGSGVQYCYAAHYRITVLVTGPRNSIAVAQSLVAL